jgi:hypothetical protein
MLKREKSDHTLFKNQKPSAIDTSIFIGSNNKLKQKKTILSATAGVLSFSFCNILLLEHAAKAKGGLL